MLRFLVPRTGFEPAHPCERCDLNTVRLPISPPGLFKSLNTFSSFQRPKRFERFFRLKRSSGLQI